MERGGEGLAGFAFVLEQSCYLKLRRHVTDNKWVRMQFTAEESSQRKKQISVSVLVK